MVNLVSVIEKEVPTKGMRSSFRDSREVESIDGIADLVAPFTVAAADGTNDCDAVTVGSPQRPAPAVVE